jgi:hypothetical protein
LLSADQSVRIHLLSVSNQVNRMLFRVYGMALGVGALGILVGALLFGLHPQAQEAGENEGEQVTSSELDLYIDVYTSMQADHDLTLETILAQRGVPLATFRNIERRVQKQERLVRKVREALQAQAKTRAEALGPPAAHAEAPASAPAPKAPAAKAPSSK